MAEQEQQYVRAGSMRVDLSALARLAYRCEPRLCGIRGSCCRHYDVWMDDREARRVESMFPAVRQLFPQRHALHDRRSVMRRTALGRYVLRKDDHGCCTLSHRTPDGRLLCTLHTAALEEDIPLREAKPRLCLLWPLSLSRAEPPVLSVQEGVEDFPCCRSREPDTSLHEGVEGTIQLYFGSDAADLIQRRLPERNRT